VIARLRDTAGYSLVEMLSVLMIMSIVLAGLTTVFVSGSTASSDVNRRFQAQQETRLALDRLRIDVRCAQDVTPNTPNPWAAAQSTVTLVSTTCGNVTWCTASLGTSRWGLYRQTGSTCGSSTGTKIADYLTTSTPFSSFAHVSGCGCLASLGISLPVSVKGNAVGAYTLTDTLYLRNSTRI
jgi:prepilin-type N-terminal cleavage/methylation domain-containing protein